MNRLCALQGHVRSGSAFSKAFGSQVNALKGGEGGGLVDMAVTWPTTAV